jgi:hypothetical protein
MRKRHSLQSLWWERRDKWGIYWFGRTTSILVIPILLIIRDGVIFSEETASSPIWVNKPLPCVSAYPKPILSLHSNYVVRCKHQKRGFYYSDDRWQTKKRLFKRYRLLQHSKEAGAVDREWRSVAVVFARRESFYGHIHGNLKARLRCYCCCNYHGTSSDWSHHPLTRIYFRWFRCSLLFYITDWLRRQLPIVWVSYYVVVVPPPLDQRN